MSSVTSDLTPVNLPKTEWADAIGCQLPEFVDATLEADGVEFKATHLVMNRVGHVGLAALEKGQVALLKKEAPELDGTLDFEASKFSAKFTNRSPGADRVDIYENGGWDCEYTIPLNHLPAVKKEADSQFPYGMVLVALVAVGLFAYRRNLVPVFGLNHVFSKA